MILGRRVLRLDKLVGDKAGDTSYFLFMHYTESFHHPVPPQSTFVIPFIVMSITVLALQVASYIKVVRTKNDRLVQK